MRKVIFVLLCVPFLLLAGCGNSNKPEGKEIKIGNTVKLNYRNEDRPDFKIKLTGVNDFENFIGKQKVVTFDATNISSERGNLSSFAYFSAVDQDGNELEVVDTSATGIGVYLIPNETDQLKLNIILGDNTKRAYLQIRNYLSNENIAIVKLL